MKKIILAFSAIVCMSTASFAQYPKGKDSSKIGNTKQLQTTVITDAINNKKPKDSVSKAKPMIKLVAPIKNDTASKKKG